MVMTDEEYKAKEKRIQNSINILAAERAELFNGKGGAHIWGRLTEITKALEKLERARTRLYNQYSPVRVSGRPNTAHLKPPPKGEKGNRASKPLTQESLNKGRR